LVSWHITGLQFERGKKSPIRLFFALFRCIGMLKINLQIKFNARLGGKCLDTPMEVLKRKINNPPPFSALSSGSRYELPPCPWLYIHQRLLRGHGPPQLPRSDVCAARPIVPSRAAPSSRGMPSRVLFREMVAAIPGVQPYETE
jgi:hypothetical protein